MKMLLKSGAAALVMALSCSLMTPTHAASLGKIGGAISYPFKKGAGNGSKDVNHGGKALAYPVRKAGVNTSKTAHKATGKS